MAAKPIKLRLILLNNFDCELDNVPFEAKDSDNITAQVLSVIQLRSWTLTEGDSIVIKARAK